MAEITEIPENRDAFVLGYGMVGKATAHALNIPFYFSRTKSNITLEEGAKKRFCFICLPTETDGRGGQGKAVQVILDYIKQIIQYPKCETIFIVRSTVLPGTTNYLIQETKAKIAFVPEFLSEATADFDAMHPRMVVIGGEEPSIINAVHAVFIPIKSKLNIYTDTVTAETIKYTFNTFAAVKVVFANQLYDVCQKTGANYDKVRHALHEHPWGSKHHFKVMDKGGRGAGGRCIPKDLKAFAKFSGSDLLKTVEKLNTEYLEQSKKE